MNLSFLNPFIRYARYYTQFEVQKTPVTCYDCRIFYLRSGKGIVTLGKTDYPISSGMFLYFPMGTRYQFFFSDDVEMVLLNFDLISDYHEMKNPLHFATDSDFDEAKLIKYNLPEEFSSPIIFNSPRLFDLLKKCVDEYLNASPFYRDISSAYLKQCLIEYLREKSLDAEFKIANKVINFIRKNYQNVDLSNTDVAAYFDYHPYYLSNLLKQATGMSLRQYIIYYRIRIAKNLLTTTTLDIGSVSLQSGFGSARYFNKIFKEHTGITPKEYRKSHIFI